MRRLVTQNQKWTGVLNEGMNCEEKNYTLKLNITGTFILSDHMHRVHVVCILKKINIQQKFVIQTALLEQLSQTI